MNCSFCLFSYDILHPDTFFNKDKSDKCLQHICNVYSYKNLYSRHGSIMDQQECCRNIDGPSIKAVEKERDKYSSAGTQTEIAGMNTSEHWHEK